MTALRFTYVQKIHSPRSVVDSFATNRKKQLVFPLLALQQIGSRVIPVDL